MSVFEAQVMRVLVALGALVSIAGSASAADGKDTSGKLTSWNVTRDGKTIGSESLRVVEGESGTFFASGELKIKTGKRVHKKTHLQRDELGKILKYQRVLAGLKGAGYRLFSWQGQMRLAPINQSGKPVDVGVFANARIRDEGLWHLYQTWGLPTGCETRELGYFDLGTRTSATARLICVGQRKVFDGDKAAVELNRFKVDGLAGEAVELWVDARGALIGAQGEGRAMLRSKYTLESGQKGEEAEGPDEDDETEEAIKDRGVGE
jgi:hypothetical protein